MQPDETWLKKFCASIGISVKRSQELEAVRRSHCDVAAITSFFDKNSKMLDRDPHLIFNMDETMISSKRKFKVLIKNGKKPYVTTPSKFPHVTACICFNAAGYKLKPFLIFPNKATLRGLENYKDYFHIASSISSWMNRELFFIWCIEFVCEITLYRLSLDESLRNQPILLITDGHKSQ